MIKILDENAHTVTYPFFRGSTIILTKAITHTSKMTLGLVTRAQLMDLETLFKVHVSQLNIPLKPYKRLNFFIRFVTTAKSCHAHSAVLVRITVCSVVFKSITEIIKNQAWHENRKHVLMTYEEWTLSEGMDYNIGQKCIVWLRMLRADRNRF